MILDNYTYIEKTEHVKDLLHDTEMLMAVNGKKKTFQHMLSVAEVSGSLSDRFGLVKEKCFDAAILHDVSAIIKPSDMLEYSKRRELPLCEAEMRYPFLLHQRLSKIVAEEYFSVHDADTLSAIECHTTLKKNASAYDMVLFIADKLAWDQEGVPPFYDAVSEALKISLEKACYVYMRYMEESGKLLYPHINWTEALLWLKTRI